MNNNLLLVIKYLFFIVLGYLLGSIMFGYLIPRYVRKINIREVSDDGNPGTVNTFIKCGKIWGGCTLVLELLKGFIPVFLAKHFLSVNNLLFTFVLVAPIIGHAYPIYDGLKGGGKCIAVSFGVLLGLLPYCWLAALLAIWFVFFSIILIVNPHSLRCTLTFICFAITAIFMAKNLSIYMGCLFMSIIVIIRHIKSLKEMEGTEVRFAFRKR